MASAFFRGHQTPCEWDYSFILMDHISNKPQLKFQSYMNILCKIFNIIWQLPIFTVTSCGGFTGGYMLFETVHYVWIFWEILMILLSVLTSTFLFFQSSKIESAEEGSPVTPPLSKECLPRNFQRPTGMGYSSSDSLDQHPMQSHNYHDSVGLASTPKLSNISRGKTETSSLDASARTSSSSRDECDHSGELSISNASDLETEWVEQDEPGVYITIRALPSGTRELRRVRFRFIFSPSQ